MSGTDEQRAIMDAELYWFGGQLSAPKVYDTTGTNFHAPPAVKEAVGAVALVDTVATSERRIRAFVDGDGDWTVTIDES